MLLYFGDFLVPKLEQFSVNSVKPQSQIRRESRVNALIFWRLFGSKIGTIFSEFSKTSEPNCRTPQLLRLKPNLP